MTIWYSCIEIKEVFFYLFRFRISTHGKSVCLSLFSDYDPPMDLALLVDSSSAADWNKMRGLLKGYVGTRNISYENDHVAIVSFASSSNVDWPFPTSSSPDYTKGRIWQAIDDLKQQGGDDRRIDYGLETITELFGSERGARRDARQVNTT